MSRVILYIDGENLKHYLKDVLIKAGIKEEKTNLENLNLDTLFEAPLKGLTISKKRYYSARLRLYHEYPQTIKKSEELILKQRVQKTNLEKLGFEYILAGNIRPQQVRADGKTKIIFKEKGVDVRIAVDMVTESCDKSIKTAVLCSSDSDLQPVVREIRQRGIEVIYLGFEISPNKGLSYTTNRTIIIRNSEVFDTYKKMGLPSKK